MSKPTESNHTASYLAQNLRYLRHKKSWSQLQLAQQAEVPRTTLTHMESGQGNPSLSNLVKVAGALGVGVEELLSRPRSACSLIPAADIPRRQRQQGRIQILHLLPDPLRGLAIDHMTLAPGSTLGGQPHLPGTKEYLYLLSGQLRLYVSGEPWDLSSGDVLAFPGNQAHSYHNPGSVPASALSVVIPVPASL